MVVIQKSADALAPSNRPDPPLVSPVLDQFVAEALMVALALIVDHKLREHSTEVSLAQRNEAIQALFFDGANKPLRMRMTVRRTERVSE